MAENKFEVQNALSSRSSCKKCKGKIEKGELRIGWSQDPVEEDDGAPKNYAALGTKWYHLACFPTMRGDRWMKQNCCELAQVIGRDTLSDDDQKRVTDIWSLIKGDTSAGGRGVSTKRAASIGVEELRDTIEVQGVFTDDEFKKFKACKEGHAKKTVKQLQAMLEKNNVVKSGSRAEVLERVAENTVLGVLPQCNLCNKGRLTWCKMDGTIHCGGFYDEVTRIRKKCKGPTNPESLTRTPWKDAMA